MLVDHLKWIVHIYEWCYQRRHCGISKYFCRWQALVHAHAISLALIWSPVSDGERKRAGSPQRAKQMVSSGHSNSSGQSCLWGAEHQDRKCQRENLWLTQKPRGRSKWGSTSQRNILLLSALLKLWRFIGDLSCVFYAGCWSEFLKEIKTGWSFGVWSFLLRNLMFKTLGCFMTLLGSFSHGETSENLTIKRSLLCLLCPMGCSLGF